MRKEKEEFEEAIKKDIAWLGFEYDAITHASDYYEDIYNLGKLINIKSNELVPGDIVFLESGDKISAEEYALLGEEY